MVEAGATTYASDEPRAWMEGASLDSIERWEFYPAFINAIDPESDYDYDLTEKIKVEVEGNRGYYYEVNLNNPTDEKAKVCYYVFFYDDAGNIVKVAGNYELMDAGKECTRMIRIDLEDKELIDHYKVLVRGFCR